MTDELFSLTRELNEASESMKRLEEERTKLTTRIKDLRYKVKYQTQPCNLAEKISKTLDLPLNFDDVPESHWLPYVEREFYTHRMRRKIEIVTDLNGEVFTRFAVLMNDNGFNVRKGVDGVLVSR